MRQVVAVVGPTAVGKTGIALRLAEDFRGEIVSLDSRQMVRGMDIGTAKPSAQMQARVRHHLIDITAPDRSLTLAHVQRLAYEAIEEILDRDRLPILAGGTGQYYRAVVEGWVIPSVAPDKELREELAAVAAERGPNALHERLASVDPRAAGRIAPSNVRRVIRALEVYEHTGVPISELQAKAAPRYDFLIVGLTRPRPELYERIDRRIDEMIEAGLQAEVASLVESGCTFDLPAMSGLGYREWRGYFGGEIDLAEVVRLIRRNTRRLVRQQATWFRADDEAICWFDLSVDGYEAVLSAVTRFLCQ